MPRKRLWEKGGVLAVALGLSLSGGIALYGASSSPQKPAEETESKEPVLKSLPVPADPELERQIEEVQDALKTVYKQMVRRKETLQQTDDLAKKDLLHQELEVLQRDRKELEGLLRDLVEEAKVSQRTAIDEAIARARWWERQQERWDKQEELIRDRQQ